MLSSTQRFSTRVDNYIKYRPGYPPAVLRFLTAECGLTPGCMIADIGSGTGILTRLFLENGNRVYGVEPNREMREAGERLLAGFDNFTSLAGTAEATTLLDGCVDFVTAGQAFHWFDRPKARVEFVRILRPGGWVALIWNSRRKNANPFHDDYEQLLQTLSTDYSTVDHTNVGPADFQAFFDPGGYRVATFPNEQVFDCEGLRGRLLSSSYALEPGHPKYELMLAALYRLFDKHQVEGRVKIEYDTEVIYGQLQG